MSLEKVVPTMKDALHLLRLLCRSCTGQKLSAYVSMDSGPKKKDEIDGPEELFIVIVDNGRSRIYQDLKARDALRCIRCAACLNICPVYRQIGGYAYGWAYSGPMGQVLNPLLLGLRPDPGPLPGHPLFAGPARASARWGSIIPACSSITGPRMSWATRNLKGKKRPWAEEKFFRMWGRAATHPWLWNLGVRMVRPVLNKDARDGVIRKAKGPFAGWFRTRDFPAMTGTPFHERWKKIKKG